MEGQLDVSKQLRFSIIIPTRDRPGLLPRSVASAIEASREGDEILVVDDGSQRSPTEILRQFDHPRLRLAEGQGKGAAHARNVGIRIAKGDVLLFLDDDDEMVSGYRDHISDLLDSALPSPQFGYSAVYQADREGRVSARLPEGYFNATHPFKSLLNGFGMGFWARRSVFEKLGLIDETLVTNEDTEFLLRLLASDHIGWYSAAPGVRLGRVHAKGADLGSLTHRTPPAARAEAFSHIAARHSDLIDRLDGARAYFQKRLIKYLARAGRIRDALALAERRPRDTMLAIGEYVSGRARPRG